MTYKEKIEELLDNAPVDQIRAVATKAMIDAMPKAVGRVHRYDPGLREHASKMVSAIEDHWHMMLNSKAKDNWRDSLRFRGDNGQI